jgi:SAM-dependent methyltransferase
VKCRICFNDQNNPALLVREMMFGTGTSFEYFECSNCGCLQITNYPHDLGLHYPDNYYSVGSPTGTGLKNKIKAWRNRQSFKPKGILGIFVNHFIPENRFQSLRFIQADKKQKILDIGCGSGEMLQFLNSWGFTNLTGIDPFIDKDIIYNTQLRVYKKNVYEIDNQYDFIMMHHAFEHMENPEEVLKVLCSYLSEKGKLLIRIPVGKSFAYETYKKNWVQLDAPRHLYLHTAASMHILCERAGLKIESILFDSMPFQFWGSEMYKNNIPLVSKAGWITKITNHIKYRLFHNYSSLSRKLNKQQRGDQAAFYVQKSNG